MRRGKTPTLISRFVKLSILRNKNKAIKKIFVNRKKNVSITGFVGKQHFHSLFVRLLLGDSDVFVPKRGQTVSLDLKSAQSGGVQFLQSH